MQRNCLRRAIGTLCFLLLILAAHAGEYTVTGGKGTPLLASEETNYKLQVYLVYGMENVEIRYTPQSGSYQWYRFKTKALDGEPIPSVQEGGTTVVRGVEDGYGYYVKENDNISTSSFVWIIDYSKYAFDITSLYVDTQHSDCMNMYLAGDMDIKDLKYSNPATGYPTALNREFEVIYQTMVKNEDETAFLPQTVTATIHNPSKDPLEAPLCDTDVTLKGDLFARHFGVEKTMTTEVYQAIAVEAKMKIDTLSYATDIPNMVVKGDSLSAPVELNFAAVANTPVAALFKWEIFRKAEGEEGEGTMIVNSSSEEVSHLFNQNGTYTVRLTVSDRTGQCEADQSETTINISDTYIDVPNAFSPGMSPGINDEFRVAYRSLMDFKCWIFNRWGAQIYYWTDPAQGWDGKKGGKYVAPGVYFYVIEATGSDGKRIKKKGSINILRSKQVQNEIIEE